MAQRHRREREMHTLAERQHDRRVRLNKGTETAIDRDDREIVRFRFRFSSQKCLDKEPYFLLEKLVFAISLNLQAQRP
jgi:hypothetical protein